MFVTRTVLLLASAAAGCGEPAIPKEPGLGALTEGPGAGDELTTSPTTGADDGLDSTGVDAPADACLFVDSLSESRFVHQCKGEVSVNFGAEGEMVPETTRFGFDYGDDSYSEPLVMACCEPSDPGNHSFCGDGYELACAADLVETLCISLVHRLNALGEATTVGSSQIFALAHWVNEHQTQCLQTFLIDTGVWDLPHADTCDPVEVTDMLTATWSIPNSDEWPDIINPFITLEEAQITDLYIPDDGTALECMGPGFNEGVSFPETRSARIDEIKMVLDDGQGALVGPEVSGYGFLRSLETGCGPGHCSNARFHDRMDGTWELTGLWLYGAAPVDLVVQETTVTLDSYNIALETSVAGTSASPGMYHIDSGQARFVVGARGMGTGASLRAENTSSITIEQNGDGWSMLPFTISYEDSEGRTWDLVVSQTDWSFAQ